MKVLIVRTASRGVNAGTGFYNSQEVGLARALSRLGHQCDIVCFGGKTESVQTLAVDNGGSGRQIKVFFLKGIPLYDSGLFFGLFELAAGYDVIQAHEYDQVETWLLARRFPEKTVVYHGPYFSEINSRYNLKCKLANLMFVPTYRRHSTPFITKSDLASDMLRSAGLQDVKTVGVGLDVSQLEKGQAAECGELLTHIGVLAAGGAKLLLYVGKIEPRRNPYLLLDVLTALRADTNVALVVIGSGEEGYLHSWKGAVQQKGLRDSVLHVERLSQNLLPYVYERCNLFLLPTSYEIFGMVLLEAMYYGLPVVTTRNGGSGMLIESGANGEIVESLEVEEWAETVQGLLLDETRAASYGEKAHTKISERFTWDALAPSFVAAYREKIKGVTT